MTSPPASPSIEGVPLDDDDRVRGLASGQGDVIAYADEHAVDDLRHLFVERRLVLGHDDRRADREQSTCEHSRSHQRWNDQSTSEGER